MTDALDRFSDPQRPGGTGADALQDALTGIPFVGGGLGGVGRLLLVLVATGALVTLAVLLITAGLLNLLGFGPGDVAKLTPPGRAGTMAEVAVSAARKN